jgi:signal transduction histidine kinase
MSSDIKLQDSDDLVFFGKINASISHELKNIFAIISEAAGLLNDLTNIASEGGDLDLEMIRTCSQDIVEEIQRGFATVKQMNTFSHSVDHPIKSVNLVEVLDLVINLAGFLSYAAKIRFEHSEAPASNVTTCPWRLQNLVYQILVFAFESVGPDGEIQISLCSQESGGGRITFSGLGSKSSGRFPVDEAKRLAASIDAEISVSGDYRTLDILMPQNMKSRE